MFLFLPAIIFSQTTLVKWFNSNLQPTLIENHITAQPVSGVVHHEYGSQDAFFHTNGNYTSSSTPDPSKYIQFSVKAENGYNVELSNFGFSARKNGGSDAQKFQVKYSKKADFSDAQILLGETVTKTSYLSFNPSFPVNTVVGSGETMYVRIYVYNTNNNFHLEHNYSGSTAPALAGKVNLVTPIRPVAFDDRSGTTKNTPVSIDILANDLYNYTVPLTAITVNGAPKNGTASVNAQKILYTPTAGYTGFDVFYYTITNAVGVSNTAKVELQVIDGSDVVIERWNQSDYTAVNYVAGVTGSVIQTKGGVTISNFNPYWVNNIAYKAFKIEKMPIVTDLNGALDPNKYVQFSINSSLQNDLLLLKKFRLQYNAEGSGNFTVKYSKDPAFSANVQTLVDNRRYVSQNNGWSDLEATFVTDGFLYPSETLYVRVYFYNTEYKTAKFYIKYGLTDNQNPLSGPVFTAIKSEIYAEPCTRTAEWSAAGWSEAPTINKKARISADFSTKINGAFKACSLEVVAGKLTITDGLTVELANQINVANTASVVVESGANLIQLNDAASANSGNITVLRDINIGAARTQYNYLGSPVEFGAGQTYKTIYPGIAFSLYHNEANNLFYNSSGVNIPGRGLAVKEPTIAGVPAGNSTVTAKYIGVPQNGIISFTIANTNTGTNTSLGYNLVGNPYPSNIDLQELYKLNRGNPASPNISSTFYLWDNEVNNDVAESQQGSSYGGQAYAVFNSATGSNGTGTTAAGYSNSKGSAKIPGNVVSVAQGFMVKANVKNYALKFHNIIRTDQKPPHNFLGKTEPSENVPDDRFWVKMITPSNLTNALAVVYFEGGQKAMGVEDSESRGGSDELYSAEDGVHLAINGRDKFQDTDAVVLGSRHYAEGLYTFELAEKEGIFANGQNIYLKDIQTGIITNLSQGSYTFNTHAGESTGRFEIVYKAETVLVTDSASKEQIVIYRDANEVVIKSPKIIAEVEVYDSSGKLWKQINSNQKMVKVDVSSLPNAVYILKIKTLKGEVVSRKFIR